MLFFKKLFQGSAKSKEADQLDSLVDDLPEVIEWAAENLTASGYLADYSLASIEELDYFFDLEGQEEGVLHREDGGIILFALGAYLGQTLVDGCGGQWLADDQDPKSEINLAVQFEDGRLFYPVKACLKRLRKGRSESLVQATQDFIFLPELEALQDPPNEVE